MNDGRKDYKKTEGIKEGRNGLFVTSFIMVPYARKPLAAMRKS
jgi:hypothetical protein